MFVDTRRATFRNHVQVRDSTRSYVRSDSQEVEADRKLDKRHMVEDAMTAALIRKCPKCDKAFLKEHG